MKKGINKCLLMIVLSLSLTARSYAQKSLVSEEWQQRMTDILPELKKEWTEELNRAGQPVTRGVELTQEDLLNAVYMPIANLILDYNSYRGLTTESKLEELIKLDTTRIDYTVFNKRMNNYGVAVFGYFRNGRWRGIGFGKYQSSDIDFINQMNAKNISFCKLRIFISPERVWECPIFYENGQLMCFRPDMPAPKPLLKALIERREYQEKRRQYEQNREPLDRERFNAVIDSLSKLDPEVIRAMGDSLRKALNR